MDFEWLKDMLLWLPQKVWELILAGLGAIIENIPVPDWLASIGSFGAGIPPGVAYIFQVMQIPEGLAMMMSAYVLRFIIRRIPVIG